MQVAFSTQLLLCHIGSWSDVTDVLDVESGAVSVSSKAISEINGHHCYSCDVVTWTCRHIVALVVDDTRLHVKGQVSTHVSPPHPTNLSQLSVLCFLSSQPFPLSWY